MQLLQKLLGKLNGLYYQQEYLCMAKESFQQPLRVYLAVDRRIIREITWSHIFAGYNPLVIALYSTLPDLPGDCTIIFSPQSLAPNEFFTKKDAIAQISLKYIREHKTEVAMIRYYEGVKAEHHFLSSFHQYIIGLNNRLYNKKKGNVFLHDNLYKQVQIAYSIPRIISLVTVGNGESYNLFPTDLHGPVNEQYYIDSLRHEGKACRQVENAGKILISEVHSNSYKTVYSLGKNHMQELKSRDHFPFGKLTSATFQLPLPEGVLHYRELELKESFVQGIHKIMLFKTVSSNKTGNNPATLSHIHNVYATWRHKQGLPDNYLLR
jgi:hypothetical protein